MHRRRSARRRRCLPSRLRTCSCRLRHRPDRVSPWRGSLSLELLQALNTGHLGGLSTIHANSAEQPSHRLPRTVCHTNVRLCTESKPWTGDSPCRAHRANSQTRRVAVRGYDVQSNRFPTLNRGCWMRSLVMRPPLRQLPIVPLLPPVNQVRGDVAVSRERQRPSFLVGRMTT